MSCVTIKGHWQIVQPLAAFDKGLHYLHYLHKANAYLSLTKIKDENNLIYKNGDPQLINGPIPFIRPEDSTRRHKWVKTGRERATVLGVRRGWFT